MTTAEVTSSFANTHLQGDVATARMAARAAAQGPVRTVRGNRSAQLWRFRPRQPWIRSSGVDRHRQADAVASGFAAIASYKRLRVPTLVIWGEEDSLIPAVGGAGPRQPLRRSPRRRAHPVRWKRRASSQRPWLFPSRAAGELARVLTAVVTRHHRRS